MTPPLAARRIPLALAALLALAGCDGAPADSAAPAQQGSASELTALDAPRLLRRASLDLLGELPDPAALDAVEVDPAALDGYLDDWLEDPRFEAQLVSGLQERFQTRLDVFEIKYYDYYLEASQEFDFERSVGEEPLRLMARVVADDLPWSEIVTADWTMADEMLGAIWPLDREAGEGWQVARYTDGRPAAGILATNGMWWRYVTNPSNMNRARAAALSDLLTCQDILSRPVSFSGSVDLAESQEDAIRSDPACLACHSYLDPIAATLFGFYWYTQYNALEMSTYHPERENLGSSDIYLGVEPAWAGAPIAGLVDLGWHIGADPRFERCAAEIAAELTWRRPVDDLADFARIESLRAVYVDSGGQMKQVIRAALDTDAYRAGGLVEGASDEVEAREQTRRMLSPDQLTTAIEALTGFRWSYDGFDQLQNDTWGYRSLAGGVDGEALSRPQQDPGLTWALVVERLAQAAAAHAVAEGGAGLVDLDARPGDGAFEEQLEALHWRLYGVRAQDDWRQDVAALWTDAEALSDADAAWTLVLSAMLRDPLFVSE